MKIAKMFLIVVFVFCAVVTADEGKCYSVDSYLIVVDSNIVEKSCPNPLDASGKDKISVLQLGSWLVSDDAEILATAKAVKREMLKSTGKPICVPSVASVNIRNKTYEPIKKRVTTQTSTYFMTDYMWIENKLIFSALEVKSLGNNSAIISYSFEYKKSELEKVLLKSGQLFKEVVVENSFSNQSFVQLSQGNGAIVAVSKNQDDYMFLVLKYDVVEQEK